MKLNLIYYKAKHYFTAKPLKGHGIHSPFMFNLVRNVLYPAIKNFSTPANANLYHFQNQTIAKQYSIPNTFLKARISKNKCQILYTFSQYFKPRYIIETTAAQNLNSLYMALGNTGSQVHIITGTQQIETLIRNIANNIDLKNIHTHTVTNNILLPDIITSAPPPLLFYINNIHTTKSTLQLFEQTFTNFNSENIIIIDDIYRNSGTRKAWEQIKADNRVVVTLDLFHFGIIFYREGMQKENFKVRI